MPSHSFKLIASAVARRRGELLLVQQRYPGDLRSCWGLRGGQVEPGEELLVGLGRELLEETGLTLVRIPTIAFVIQLLRQTEEGHQQWLVCHFACEVEGLLGPQDPDGLVLSAHQEWLAERIPGVAPHIEQAEGHASISLLNMDRILQELVDAERVRL
jgi:ADP-ribose pyrophosphatase YjhB (NUDIX family)